MLSIQRECVIRELIVANKPYFQDKDNIHFSNHWKNKTEVSGC